MEPWMRRASLSSRTNIRSWHSWEYRSMKSLLGKACSTHSSRLSSLGHLVKSLIWFKWSNCLDSSHRTYFEMDRILGYGSTRLVSIYGPFIAMLISLDIHARRLSNPNNLLSGQLREAKMSDTDVPDAASFLRTMLQLHPEDRWKAKDLVDHLWFY